MMNQTVRPSILQSILRPTTPHSECRLLFPTIGARWACKCVLDDNPKQGCHPRCALAEFQASMRQIERMRRDCKTARETLAFR